MNVARILVVYLKRAGGQSQYSALLAAQAESDSESFSELERWIVEHLKSDLSVNALANRVHMSPRNFARVYAAKRGRTPPRRRWKRLELTQRGAGLRKRTTESNLLPKVAASAAKSKCVVHSSEY
jgi:transcriptional regulator GlxA family with amidase domain